MRASVTIILDQRIGVVLKGLESGPFKGHLLSHGPSRPRSRPAAMQQRSRASGPLDSGSKTKPTQCSLRTSAQNVSQSILHFFPTRTSLRAEINSNDFGRFGKVISRFKFEFCRRGNYFQKKYFLKKFDFFARSEFIHIQCDCTCACVVACF